MRPTIAGIFKALGFILYALIGLWAYIIDIRIIVDATGFIGGLIAFSLTPLTYLFTPVYALVANGDLFPLILTYLGIVPAAALYGIGYLIHKD